MICSKNNNVLIDFNDAAVVDCEGNNDWIYLHSSTEIMVLY
jgi:hypothetical protein